MAILTCSIPSFALGWLARPYVVTALGLPGATPVDPVTAAWSKARATGSYHFQSDVMFNLLIGTRMMRNAASVIYFHRKGVFDPQGEKSKS